MEQQMTVNRIKPVLGILGASLVALVLAAPSTFAGSSQPVATSISSDTVHFGSGSAVLVGDDQPAPSGDQNMSKGKSKGKHKGKAKGKSKGKSKGKGKGKGKGKTKPKSDTAPKSGE
jgi:hypothetical protein